jgi:hypothetical protein
MRWPWVRRSAFRPKGFNRSPARRAAPAASAPAAGIVRAIRPAHGTGPGHLAHGFFKHLGQQLGQRLAGLLTRAYSQRPCSVSSVSSSRPTGRRCAQNLRLRGLACHRLSNAASRPVPCVRARDRPDARAPAECAWPAARRAKVWMFSVDSIRPASARRLPRPSASSFDCSSNLARRQFFAAQFQHQQARSLMPRPPVSPPGKPSDSRRA